MKKYEKISLKMSPRFHCVPCVCEGEQELISYIDFAFQIDFIIPSTNQSSIYHVADNTYAKEKQTKYMVPVSQLKQKWHSLSNYRQTTYFA